MSGDDTPIGARKRRGNPKGNPQNLMPAWKPGQSGNPAGRPKGARSKLGEEFIDALLKDFLRGGIKAIEGMREEKPNEYARMIASILPKEIDANVNTNIGEALDDLDG